DCSAFPPELPLEDRMAPKPHGSAPLFAVVGVIAAIAGVACQGKIGAKGAGTMGGGGPAGGPGTGSGGAAGFPGAEQFPFEALPPNVYTAKVKYLTTGVPLTDE